MTAEGDASGPDARPVPDQNAGPDQNAEPKSPADQRTLRERLVPPMPTDRVWGWVAPLIVTALAAVLRLWDLGKPKALMFDETYYAKDAWSLRNHGYERTFVEGADQKIVDGATDVLQSDAAYVVHPPVGKWVIASGEYFFGLTPFGWRVAGAVLGTVAVLVLCRIARRMFRSTLLGCLAGLLLAVDGLALVMSRIALLDGILAAFVLFAFGCLVLDRDWGRARIADAVDAAGQTATSIGGRIEGLGPRLWWRPWRVAAGVFLGLAIGVKWNALFFLAAFVVLVVFWDFGARKAIGVRNYRLAALRRDLWPLVLALCVLPVVVYVATWTGWIIQWGPESGYYRNWASDRGAATLPVLGIQVPFVPDWFRSLWHYHYEAYSFHRNLSTAHPYESNPWGWLLLARPVAVYYETVKGNGCSSDNCASAITALGNPLIWWAGLLAILHSLWRQVAHRDWRGGAILMGIAAGLLPWFMYQERTVFSFYAVVLVPFIALALVQAFAAILGPDPEPEPIPGAEPGQGGTATVRASTVTVAQRAREARRTIATIVIGIYVAAVVLMSAYFWPVWTGQVIPYADWLQRMWFPSWI